MAVGEWFASFCSALRLSPDLRSSIASRTGRIVGQLNSDFRGVASDTANRFYVGSFGRNSVIPTVSDIDLLYVLPYSTYQQYNAYTGNKQSALLSAVRSSLQKTYSSSNISGDGQVVVIAFTDNIKYEILPAFLNNEGGYTFADSNAGGTWKSCKPKQEMDAFSSRDASCNSNLVQLGRMARAWRDYNSAPMNGMLIDTLAFQFMETWQYRDKSYLYYDFLTRDFFKYLAGQ
ncbi:MAG: nucleotidyltransferase, partial [Burkholderiales bacterium]